MCFELSHALLLRSAKIDRSGGRGDSMNITDYMTSDPITVFSGMPLPEARRTLRENHFRHLPVVDEEGMLIGIITDRDLRSAYPSSVISKRDSIIAYEQVEQKTVADIMTTSCSTLGIDARLDEALLIFDRDQIGGIPVVTDEGRVLGIFTLLDLTAAYRKLFGVSLKDSLLIRIEDDGRQGIVSEITHLFEKMGIHLTQLLRLSERNDVKKIYIRVISRQPLDVYKMLKDNGFNLL